VAHALLFLRHESFHAAIARIVEDENSWVREAARRTLQRRTELTRADIAGTDRDDAVLGMLSDMEARYGTQARRAALKIADHLHLQFVRAAYHEIIRIISPLDASLINLEREIGAVPGIPVRSLTHVRRAHGRVKLLTEILDNLREFVRQATGEFTDEEVLAVLKEADELARSSVDLPAAGLVVRYNVDASIKIEANRSRLLQALINIVVNAIEACHGLDHQAELTISASRISDSQVVITIADNGSGMGEEALRDCVLLYSSGKPDGMGFGLPLAKKFIETDHQGTLAIQSRQGEGTTVSIILPVEQIGAED
jgi:signal transduction histidine kinase